MLCLIKPQISLPDSGCKTLIGCRTTKYRFLFVLFAFFFFFFSLIFSWCILVYRVFLGKQVEDRIVRRGEDCRFWLNKDMWWRQGRFWLNRDTVLSPLRFSMATKGSDWNTSLSVILRAKQLTPSITLRHPLSNHCHNWLRHRSRKTVD